MSYEIINTHEVIAHFHHLMHPSEQMQVLRLVGEAKMGKSHLLTKVFPFLAVQHYQARCVILDLRNPAQTVPDFIHFACSRLGGQIYDSYYTAYQSWINRPKKVGVEWLFALFSQISISAQDNNNDLHQRDLSLTTKFAQDLSKLDDRPILFLFDTVDNATEYIQSRLMDTLLVHLSPLRHVRVAVAGRSLPAACSTYVSFCQSYQLSPVTEIEAYITYCHRINLSLGDQSIRDFVRAFRYVPGLFVDHVIPVFLSQKAPYD